jgi:competence protein ComEC
MLYPPAGAPALGNDSSCVLKITAASGSMLLDGDIEARAERRLVATAEVAADVAAVPHHGSSTSSTAAFVNATGAKFALVSAAFPSRWRFPRPDVVARWRAEGAAVRVTGRSGALTVELGPDGIEVEGERMRRKRYWRTFSESSPGTGDSPAL